VAEWDANHMRYPRWFAPYYKIAKGRKYCTRHNHTSGRGCTAKRCKYRHVCALCHTADHGAFSDKCGVYTVLWNIAIVPELADLEAHYHATGKRRFSERPAPCQETDDPADALVKTEDDDGTWTVVGRRSNKAK
jgi:hypothetical protein